MLEGINVLEEHVLQFGNIRVNVSRQSEIKNNDRLQSSLDHALVHLSLIEDILFGADGRYDDIKFMQMLPERFKWQHFVGAEFFSKCFSLGERSVGNNNITGIFLKHVLCSQFAGFTCSDQQYLLHGEI